MKRSTLSFISQVPQIQGIDTSPYASNKKVLPSTGMNAVLKSLYVSLDAAKQENDQATKDLRESKEELQRVKDEEKALADSLNPLLQQIRELIANKDKINEFLGLKTSFYELGNLNFIDKDIVCEYENHTKAFVKIQEGCDFACSYCIIPSVRGKSRSVDEQALLRQVEILGANGYSEVVLTGTNIGSYGLKNGTTLGKLLQKMGQISGIKRIRLGSLEPAQIDESFLEILDERWMERHLHIALQHTSEKMLRIMRRRSHTDNDLKLFNTIASKGYALGTDFIVGHPGETEELWHEALKHFQEFPLTHIHAFIFSPRNYTLSSTMKDTINGAVAKERLNTLKVIIENNNYEFRKRVKTPLEILVENQKDGFFEGYDQFFNKIKIKSSKDIAKEWLKLERYEVQEKHNFADLEGKK